MADDRPQVPLPEELPVRLEDLQALFGAAHDALVMIEAEHGRDNETYRHLDQALGQISEHILGQLGFWDEG